MTVSCPRSLYALALLVVTALASLATAQHLPDAPKPKVFDVRTTAELGLVAAALAADAMSTEKLMEFNGSPVSCASQTPCHNRRDGNPLVRVIARNRVGTGLYFGGMFAADVYGTYLLRKHGHRRIATLLNLGVVALESSVAGLNYSRMNNSSLVYVLHHPQAHP